MISRCRAPDPSTRYGIGPLAALANRVSRPTSPVYKGMTLMRYGYHSMLATGQGGLAEGVGFEPTNPFGSAVFMFAPGASGTRIRAQNHPPNVPESSSRAVTRLHKRRQERAGARHGHRPCRLSI